MGAAIQREVRAAIRRLDPLFPTPWDIDELVRRVAKARGRDINLIPWPMADMGRSGLWLPTERADYIFFEQTAAPNIREQIIGHEIGHLLLEHTPQLTDASRDLLMALAPNLAPEVARRVLGRSGYDTHEEAAAEEFGTMLVRRGISRHRTPDDTELGRLSRALE
jgi:hypothetical protein